MDFSIKNGLMEQNERILSGMVFKISFLIFFLTAKHKFSHLKKSRLNKFAYNHATVSAKDKETPSI